MWFGGKMFFLRLWGALALISFCVCPSGVRGYSKLPSNAGSGLLFQSSGYFSLGNTRSEPLLMMPEEASTSRKQLGRKETKTSATVEMAIDPASNSLPFPDLDLMRMYGTFEPAPKKKEAQHKESNSSGDTSLMRMYGGEQVVEHLRHSPDAGFEEKPTPVSSYLTGLNPPKKDQAVAPPKPSLASSKAISIDSLQRSAVDKDIAKEISREIVSGAKLTRDKVVSGAAGIKAGADGVREEIVSDLVYLQETASLLSWRAQTALNSMTSATAEQAQMAIGATTEKLRAATAIPKAPTRTAAPEPTAEAAAGAPTAAAAPPTAAVASPTPAAVAAIPKAAALKAPGPAVANLGDLDEEQESAAVSAGLAAFTAGALAGGPAVGAAMALIANWAARKQARGGLALAAEAARGVGAAARDAARFGLGVAARYDVGGQARGAALATLAAATEYGAVDPRLVAGVERSLGETSAKVEALAGTVDVGEQAGRLARAAGAAAAEAVDQAVDWGARRDLAGQAAEWGAKKMHPLQVRPLVRLPERPAAAPHPEDAHLAAAVEGLAGGAAAAAADLAPLKKRLAREEPRTVQLAAGVLGLAAGAAVAGPATALAASLAANYWAERDAGDAGEVARGVGRAAVDAANFAAEVADELRLGEAAAAVAGEAAGGAYRAFKEAQQHNVEDLDEWVGRAGQAAEGALQTLQRLDAEHDLQGKAGEALRGCAELSARLVGDALAYDEEHRVVEKTLGFLGDVAGTFYRNLAEGSF